MSQDKCLFPDGQYEGHSYDWRNKYWDEGKCDVIPSMYLL